MFVKLNHMLFLLLFNVSYCMRRIKQGHKVTTDKTYVVYLVRAQQSKQSYDTWLCGGALVSSVFIVTSAACVDDVEYMYAIAGYNKYVKDEDINTDKCTKEKKKKVVYTCIPMKYELKYDAVEKWSFIDIALVKVESAYDFKDESYKSVCSYIPSTISINYEEKYQAVNTDAMVLGWGHAEKWRQPGDNKNYNQEDLHYVSTLIMDKNECKKQYESFSNMGEVIEQFMICTLEEGSINEKGEHELKASVELLDGCGLNNKNNNNNPDKLNLMNSGDPSCEEEKAQEDAVYHDLVIDNTRREVKKSNKTRMDHLLEILNKTATNDVAKNKNSRKYGICQNDHGGPLVTWVGSYEVLIGVASVFKVSDEHTCIGPYLYTSTQCNGAFLDCVLSNSGLPNQSKKRRAICDSPPVLRGYDTVERHISWRNHPSGPADNERIAEEFMHKEKQGRPQTGVYNKSENYNRFAKLKKFPQNAIFAVRPQRPLRYDQIYNY